MNYKRRSSLMLVTCLAVTGLVSAQEPARNKTAPAEKAQSQGHRLIIHNNAPVAIIDYRIAPPGTDKWGENLLSIAIAAKTVRTIELNGLTTTCLVNAVAISENGHRSIMRNLDTCDANGAWNAQLVAPEPPATSPGPAGQSPSTPKPQR